MYGGFALLDHSLLLIPRGSIVLALWIRWASRVFLKESRPFLSFSTGIKSMIVGLFGCVQKQKQQQQQKVIVRVNLVVTLSHLGTRLNYITPEFGGGEFLDIEKNFRKSRKF